METDPVFLQMLQACPKMSYELAGLQVPAGKVVLRSVALKGLNRTADVVAFPSGKSDPILVGEFEMSRVRHVLQRTVMEMSQLEIDHWPRPVAGFVITGTTGGAEKLRADKWAKVVAVLSLTEALEKLPTDHALRLVLHPLLEKNKEKVAAAAQKQYIELQKAPAYTSAQRETLTLCFMNLLAQRLAHLTIQEINLMVKLPTDMKKTVLGRDLMRIGREEGREEGAAGIVKRVASLRFGAAAQAFVSQIDELNYLQLEQLVDVVNEMKSIGELKTWLADFGKKDRA
jgi:hypothetical protein